MFLNQTLHLQVQIPCEPHYRSFEEGFPDKLVVRLDRKWILLDSDLSQHCDLIFRFRKMIFQIPQYEERLFSLKLEKRGEDYSPRIKMTPPGELEFGLEIFEGRVEDPRSYPLSGRITYRRELLEEAYEKFEEEIIDPYLNSLREESEFESELEKLDFWSKRAMRIARITRALDLKRLPQKAVKEHRLVFLDLQKYYLENEEKMREESEARVRRLAGRIVKFCYFVDDCDRARYEAEGSIFPKTASSVPLYLLQAL